MVDQKISDYTVITSLADDDLIDISQFLNPGYQTRSIKWSDVLAASAGSIYAIDSTLATDRTVTMDGNFLLFQNNTSSLQLRDTGNIFEVRSALAGNTAVIIDDARDMLIASTTLAAKVSGFKLTVAGNIIAKETGAAILKAQGTDRAALLLHNINTATANKRQFEWMIESGQQLELRALNDFGAIIRTIVNFDHDGNTFFGAGTIVPSARMQIRGEGTVNLVTLRTEDSAGIKTLEIQDDGDIFFKDDLFTYSGSTGMVTMKTDVGGGSQTIFQITNSLDEVLWRTTSSGTMQGFWASTAQNTIVFSPSVGSITCEGVSGGIKLFSGRNSSSVETSFITANGDVRIAGSMSVGDVSVSAATLHVRGAAGHTIGFVVETDGGTETFKVFDDQTIEMGTEITVDASIGNILMGNTDAQGISDRVLTITNGAVAPASGVVDSIQIYAKDVTASSELFVMDEAGNETQLSPHDKKGNFYINSYSGPKKKRLIIHLEKMLNKLAKMHPDELSEFIEYSKK